MSTPLRPCYRHHRTMVACEDCVAWARDHALAAQTFNAQQRTAQLRRDMAGRDTAARLLAGLT